MSAAWCLCEVSDEGFAIRGGELDWTTFGVGARDDRLGHDGRDALDYSLAIVF